MDLAAARADIVVALSTAPDVTGHALRPVKLRAGDAWPLLGALERADGHAFTTSWRVLVYLPQDAIDASNWVDGHHEQLVDALEPVGFVDRIEPVLISDSGEDKYALQITMRGE